MFWSPCKTFPVLSYGSLIWWKQHHLIWHVTVHIKQALTYRVSRNWRQDITRNNYDLLSVASLGTASTEIQIKFNNLHSIKCIWTCCLQHCGHFLSSFLMFQGPDTNKIDVSIASLAKGVQTDSKVHGANMGPTWGPTGPMWAPCWPHEPCYLGSQWCNISYRTRHLYQPGTCAINGGPLMPLKFLTSLRLNKRLSKQSWGWWFETPSCPLWRHRNDMQNCAIASVVTRKNMDKQFNGGLLVDTMHKHSIRPKWITVIVIVIAYLLIVLRSLSLPIIYHISIIWDYFDICEICVKLVGYDFIPHYIMDAITHPCWD